MLALTQLTPTRVLDNGTVTVNVRSLREHGFGSCVTNRRPCIGARVIDPTVKREGCVLCCGIRHTQVSAAQAADCEQQQ